MTAPERFADTSDSSCTRCCPSDGVVGYDLRWGRPMRRRDFVTLLGGAATWPLAARAQQSEPMRRIGALTGIGDDERGQARFAVFVQALAQLGWIDGRNVRIDYRWGGGDIDKIRKHATELAARAPDVIFATGGPSVEQLL